MRNQGGKIKKKVKEESTWMNLSEGYHFLAARPLFYAVFCCFLSTPSFSSNPILCIKFLFFALENGVVARAVA